MCSVLRHFAQSLIRRSRVSARVGLFLNLAEAEEHRRDLALFPSRTSFVLGIFFGYQVSFRFLRSSFIFTGFPNLGGPHFACVALICLPCCRT